MNTVKFITTFSNNGYHVYGQKWIESFIEQTKNYDNITADVYVEYKETQDYWPKNSKIKYLFFDTDIPEHTIWKNNFESFSNHDPWNKKLGLKFSFKSFVMMHALKNSNTKYLIWLDADCLFVGNNFDDFPKKIINDKFIACQFENHSEHIESGIIIFDCKHKDKNIFLDTIKKYYTEEFNNFGQPFDGYIIHRAVKNTEVSYENLNEKYGINGIQSDPNLTFLHPEIKKRFIHNIGITGKQSYKSWESYCRRDEFFRLLPVNTFHPSPEQIQNDMNTLLALRKK
jgi:hypothetical protein